MKDMYQVTFRGDVGQKYSICGVTFVPNVSVYYNRNIAPLEIVEDKVLEVEKVVFKKKGEIVSNDIREKVMDSPVRVGVTFVGHSSEMADIRIKGSFVVGKTRWDLTDEEVEIARTLGNSFNFVEEEIWK